MFNKLFGNNPTVEESIIGWLESEFISFIIKLLKLLFRK